MATLAALHTVPLAGLAADTALLAYAGTDGAILAYRLYHEISSIQDESDLESVAKVLEQELAAQAAGKLLDLLTWGAVKGTAKFNKHYDIQFDHDKVRRLSTGEMPLSANPGDIVPIKIVPKNKQTAKTTDVPTAPHQPPLSLTYQPTTLNLDQVRRLPQPTKWQAGEQYVQELYGSRGQGHFTVPEGNGITGKGGRFVDTPINLPNTGILAVEVKTYGQWRTVGGTPQQQTIPLSEHIRQQILKDVWLRDHIPNYDPRWIFLDAPPSTELLGFLKQHRIVNTTHNVMER